MRQLTRIVACLMFAACSTSTSADPVLITAPKTIGPTDTTITPTAGGNAVPLAQAEIIVRGTTLTINGRHTIQSLVVERNASNVGGIVTHGANFSFDYSGGAGTDVVFGMQLTTLGDVFVQGQVNAFNASRISSSGLGFPGGQGPGAGGSTSGNYCGGGGYGGTGGKASSGALGGEPYGLFATPRDFGSGGGKFSTSATTAGRGGGAMRITVGGTLTVNGSITSNGTIPSDNFSGCGSGGSIWITCDTLTGTGIITANGGSRYSGIGGGAGGRIALYSCNIQILTGKIVAKGGGNAGGQTGTGSVYFGSSSINILLQPPPFTEYTAGGKASLVVDALGDGPLTYQWYRDDRSIVDDGRISGATTSKLTFSPIDCADCGTFYCLVRDSCGAFPTDPAQIAVLAPSDYDGSGFVDGDDFDAFVLDFEAGADDADFDGSGFVDTNDFTAFVLAFEAGC